MRSRIQDGLSLVERGGILPRFNDGVRSVEAGGGVFCHVGAMWAKGGTSHHSGAAGVRFSLVDRILTLKPGQSISAVKNLTIAEEYLADHFPGFPVMPGVLMIESLVQAGGWLLRETEGFQYSTILLKEARAVKFNNFVKPGHALHVECEIIKQEGNLYTLKGAGTVDGTSAVSAKITLEQFNLADRNPDLKKSDDLRIQKLRELFACLWSERPVTRDES